MIDDVETGKANYEGSSKMVKKEPKYIFQLPNMMEWGETSEEMGHKYLQEVVGQPGY